MTLDRRMRQAAESVRRYAEHEVDPVAMLWRLRAHQRRRSLRTAAVALARLAVVARGSLWLVDEAAGTVSQADPRTGRTLQTVNVGAAPAGPNPLEERFRLAFDRDA